MTGASSDLNQVTRAVRSGQLDFGIDTGTADALVAKISLAHIAIKAGLPFVVVKSAAPNATTIPTLTIEDTSGNNGLTATIVKNNGSAVAPGDLPANALLVVRAISASKFALVSLLTISDTLQVIQTQFLITTAITKTIGPTGSSTTYDFPTPVAAINWLGKYLITSTGSVTFQVAAGQFVSAATLVWDHPTINRVSFKGTRTAAAPTSLVTTGYTSTARANDAITNLANLRSVFLTELRFTGGTGITSVSPSPAFQDLLITGDGAGTDATGANGLQVVNGGSITNVAIHGFSGEGFRCDGGEVIVQSSSSLLIAACGATGSGNLAANSSGTVVVNGTLVTAGGAAHGISTLGGFVRRSAAGAISTYGNALNGANFQGGRYDGGGISATYNGGQGVAGYASGLDLFQANAGANAYYGLPCDGTPAVARNMTFNPANGSGTISAVGPASQVDALNASVNSTESPAINTYGNRQARIATS